MVARVGRRRFLPGACAHKTRHISGTGGRILIVGAALESYVQRAYTYLGTYWIRGRRLRGWSGEQGLVVLYFRFKGTEINSATT